MAVPSAIQQNRNLTVLNGVADSSGELSETPEWLIGELPVVTLNTGGVTQGTNGTITGSNFSSYRQTPLFFTDFEELNLSDDVVSSYTQLGGSAPSTNTYTVSDSEPLTGTKTGLMIADQINMSDLYVNLENIAGWNRDRMFLEYFAKINKIDVTATPDAPQVKVSRISSGENHTDQPFLGITDQMNATMTFANGNGISNVRWPVNDRPNNTYYRETYYFELSTPDNPDGMMVLRTSFNNQWTLSGGEYFSTPNEWTEPRTVTRVAAASAAQLTRARLPFFQRAQQTTHVTVNHIFATDTNERVILSTSSTRTAAFTEQHVACPTISRSYSEIVYKSMIDCLPAGVNVYAYVVNDDGLINADGVLVRSV